MPHKIGIGSALIVIALARLKLLLFLGISLSEATLDMWLGQAFGLAFTTILLAAGVGLVLWWVSERWK